MGTRTTLVLKRLYGPFRLSLSAFAILLLMAFVTQGCTTPTDTADSPTSVANETEAPAPTELPQEPDQPQDSSVGTTATVVTDSPTAPAAADDPTTVGEFFLALDTPEAQELIVQEPDLLVTGRTTVDAIVTVNDEIVIPDSSGRFESLVPLAPGPNVIEIVGSVFTGETDGIVLTAVFLP